VERDEQEALSAVCEELPALREEVGRHPDERARLLARIEAEAAARRPILSLLAELLGTNAEGTRTALAAGLPGVGAGHADEERFVCPDGACNRTAKALPAGPAPSCWVTRQPMRRH
jgi:hypothetical protein